ncbi:MAG: heme ABC transporter ATP-binding protein [Edaphocola sp.]
MLELRDIRHQIAGRALLHSVSGKVRPGAVTALMGSNGAGKSTLLKIISGEQKPTSGAAFWAGKNVAEWPVKELAKTRAVLRQQYQVQVPFTAYEIIAMGRYPHYKNQLTAPCKLVIEKVAGFTGVTHLLQRNYLNLSGGEQQRVQLARVLAQIWDTPSEHKLLLLDEPVSALDIHYQHQLMSLAKALADAQITVVAVLHDLNLAMQYADDVLLLKKGNVVDFGKKEAVLNRQNIKETFGVQADLHTPENFSHSFITVCPVQTRLDYLGR